MADFARQRLLERKQSSTGPNQVDAADFATWFAFALVAWGLLALLPHDSPYYQSLLLDLTLLAWSWPVWVFAGIAWLGLFGIGVASAARKIQPLRLWTWVLGFVALLLGAGTGTYVSLLSLNGLQDSPNDRLAMCVAHCEHGPRTHCVHAPPLALDARTPAARASDAVSFFRSNVYGSPRAVTAFSQTSTVTATWGTTGRAECAHTMNLTSSANNHVLLVVGDVGKEARRLATARGWDVVGVSHTPPDSCFPGEAAHGRRIANEAALINAVAEALYPELKISLWGCSVNGKIAAYAAATALDDVGVVYTNVLLDSPGTLGLASARVVGRCGESFPGLLDRWEVWLATNASNVRDVSTQWGSVDAGDLMLATCHDTKYLVSSSRLDLWNNPSGLSVAVEAARATGCVVEFVNPDGAQHCGLFS